MNQGDLEDERSYIAAQVSEDPPHQNYILFAQLNFHQCGNSMVLNRVARSKPSNPSFKTEMRNSGYTECTRTMQT